MIEFFGDFKFQAIARRLILNQFCQLSEYLGQHISILLLMNITSQFMLK